MRGLPLTSQPERSFKVSLISRLRAVVAGDDYLDGDLDDLVYDDDQPEQDQRASQADGGALPPSVTATPSIWGTTSRLQCDRHAGHQHRSCRSQSDGAPQLR